MMKLEACVQPCLNICINILLENSENTRQDIWQQYQDSNTTPATTVTIEPAGCLSMAANLSVPCGSIVPA